MFFHDTNNNGTLDRLLGISKERFRFSNDALLGFGMSLALYKVKFFVLKNQKSDEVLKAQ